MRDELRSANVTGRRSIASSVPSAARVTRSGNAASIAGVSSGKLSVVFDELLWKYSTSRFARSNRSMS